MDERLFIFGIVAFLVGLVVVAYLRNYSSPVPRINPNQLNTVRMTPSKLLGAFVTTYQDKIRLEEQWRRLDQRVQQERITQTTFHKEKQELDRELSQVEDNVKILRAQLREEGKDYRDFVDELELNEIEKTALLISMDELTNRYIKGQMSKEHLEKFQKEYDIKFQSITAHIEQILAELQDSII